MLTEDQVEKKYEDEFARYCFSTLEITHQDGYLRRLENGEFWDWLKEYHYDEWKALEDEDNKRIMTKEEPQGIVYDPPMSDTEQYLLNKEREEEHKSYDY